MTQHCIDDQYWHGRLSPRGARHYENYWAGFAHHADANGASPDWLPLSHFDLRELDETGMIRPSVQYATAFCPELFYDADVTVPAWKVEAHKVYDERMRKKREEREGKKRETAAVVRYQKARAKALAEKEWRESMAEARQRFLEKEEIRKQQHAARVAEKERQEREHEVLLQLEIHQREINFALHWYKKNHPVRHLFSEEFRRLEDRAAALVAEAKDIDSAAWWGGYMQGLRTACNVPPVLKDKVHDAWLDPSRFPDEIRKSKSMGYVAGYNKLLTAP